VLAEHSERYPFLKVVTHPRNRGYGAALRSGFAACTKELIFYTDGDGQYDPTELVALVPYAGGHALVNGYKIKRSDHWMRVIVGRLYHWTVSFLFSLTISDVDCDFRLIRRHTLMGIDLVSERGSICVEMVRKLQDAGAAIAEVPVHHYERVSGRSQFFRFGRIVLSLLKLAHLWRELILLPAMRRPLRGLAALRRVRGHSQN
jgi:glycosyltransferase involved in cell wall biosynthesis